jgi:hypothetical protein
LQEKDSNKSWEIKSPINQTKTIVESDSSRQDQVEDRISGFKTQLDIKEKMNS